MRILGIASIRTNCQNRGFLPFDINFDIITQDDTDECMRCNHYHPFKRKLTISSLVLASPSNRKRYTSLSMSPDTSISSGPSRTAHTIPFSRYSSLVHPAIPSTWWQPHTNLPTIPTSTPSVCNISSVVPWYLPSFSHTHTHHLKSYGLSAFG